MQDSVCMCMQCVNEGGAVYLKSNKDPPLSRLM
uniref:Uncharacterized protein n=1 Tax=Anguilla anguilla TaxID=7936 RepID=A0A0E9U3N9_ANGAN